jgi:hypothetical protein
MHMRQRHIGRAPYVSRYTQARTFRPASPLRGDARLPCLAFASIASRVYLSRYGVVERLHHAFRVTLSGIIATTRRPKALSQSRKLWRSPKHYVHRCQLKPIRQLQPVFEPIVLPYRKTRSRPYRQRVLGRQHQSARRRAPSRPKVRHS